MCGCVSVCVRLPPAHNEIRNFFLLLLRSCRSNCLPLLLLRRFSIFLVWGRKRATSNIDDDEWRVPRKNGKRNDIPEYRSVEVWRAKPRFVFSKIKKFLVTSTSIYYVVIFLLYRYMFYIVHTVYLISIVYEFTMMNDD